ncbi:hypothetical protein [Methanobrevibacter sp.]|uniref:hypothetical protein n=1 Tax=Methanobrevibacter sp. TaxID=66852 RepID=UPI0025ECD963|nr:hypothetical protein [Methanobrevibacter sp.]MBQ2831486.1 hypothetical protein [Methanobrevibacter sp.]
MEILKKGWNKLGRSLGDIWEKFGKIYLNLDEKMCYYRKFLDFSRIFIKIEKMEESENAH